jgi:hypothetical protein
VAPVLSTFENAEDPDQAQKPDRDATSLASNLTVIRLADM